MIEMVEKKERRILDKELEKEIKDVVDREIKKVVKGIDETQKIIEDKADETAKAIREKPFAWVGGAFIAGLLLGKLLSK
ncbi:MAG TPA: hypothetical protein EYP86_00720 [Candidatus Altiarchaeales archaeon]|nr:hypothetical protein [Candidatus Altiarchaeales archaeon]